MNNFLDKEYRVLSSVCDAQGLMGIHNVFDCFMDLAAEHAGQLGVSYYDMLEHRCYWVAVRTRVIFYDRPKLGETIHAMTWPGKPGLAKSDRFYLLYSGDRIMAEGRTEWAAQDIDTGAVRRTDSYGYPAELVHREERVCASPFTRFRPMQPEAGNGQNCRYKVNSTDIDVGRHMNNVAYVRMLMGTFSVSEHEEMDIREVEISYRRACYEGEDLDICRERTDDGWRFAVIRPDGETAVDALLRLGARE